jgi:hypothetical protein
MKKKLMAIALCLMMGLTAVMAQDNNNRRQQQRRAPQQMDAVVDTAVLNKMDIEAAVMEQILALQTTKQAEQKAQMEARRAANTGSDGKRVKLTDEQREAQREANLKEEAEFKAGYRAQLRQLLGDETYIQYLERLVDARATMRMPMPSQNRQNGQSNMPQGMPGGFGGGDFGGGDF